MVNISSQLDVLGGVLTWMQVIRIDTRLMVEMIITQIVVMKGIYQHRLVGHREIKQIAEDYKLQLNEYKELTPIKNSDKIQSLCDYILKTY